MSHIPLIFVMGPTNAGKSSVMAEAAKDSTLFLVEVGKALRAKYPPEYFAGQGNPAHTQTEAWKLLLDALDTASRAEGIRAVLCDGQPRTITQARASYDIDPLFQRTYAVLHAPMDVRRRRAANRDGADLAPMVKDSIAKGLPLPPGIVLPEALKLSMARMTDDAVHGYDVMAELHMARQRVVYATTDDKDPEAILAYLLGACYDGD